MSIENTLERIAVALEALAAQTPAPAAAPAPVAETPAPAAPIPEPAAPAPVSSAPFNDTKGLMAYITETYKALGPEKGMQIQGILQELGHNNVSDVPVEQFGALYQKIEALKA